MRMTRAKSFESSPPRRTRGERRGATLASGAFAVKPGSTCTAARRFTYRVAGDQAGRASDRWPRRASEPPASFRGTSRPGLCQSWFNGGRGWSCKFFDFVAQHDIVDQAFRAEEETPGGKNPRTVQACHEVEKLARKGGKSALAPIPASDDEKARPLMPDFRRKKIWRTAGRYPHARQM